MEDDARARVVRAAVESIIKANEAISLVKLSSEFGLSLS